MHSSNVKKIDVVLIGGGIISATLGALLQELQPDLKIEIFERLDEVALESTETNNNSGTGHSAFCELNYTPKRRDGSIDISKAVKIAEEFEVSKQFWAYLVAKKYLPSPQEFINTMPHMSWVVGQENISYLKKRHETMSKNVLFSDMEYSDSISEISKWIPLMLEGRDKSAKFAATRMVRGTDIDFGALTRNLFKQLVRAKNVNLHLNHEVINLSRSGDDSWKVFIENKKTKEKKMVKAGFVFIGAGGAAITLLQKSGIAEARNYGGFPIIGKSLICRNRKIIEKHNAKVYGMAQVGSPPMSVPHLDTRIINSKKELIFGPFAGFSTKFLKRGSYLDLPLSIRSSNILPILSAGINNISLTKYLIEQLLLTPRDRLRSLKEFLPTARLEDWRLHTAGQRVQIIKKIPGKGGVLQFGTEVVSSSDGSIAALLGASPGASVSVSIMLDLLKNCFKKQIRSKTWQKKIQEMIPSYEKHLAKDKKLCQETRAYTSKILKLKTS